MPPQIITALTREYQVEHPIALAPMAFVGSTPALAIAVCNAGGIGSLAAGILPVNVLFNTIQAIKDQTDRPFNVNFVSLFVQPEQIQLCIEQAVPIVSFHWGAPEPVYIQQLKDAGIKVWMQVGSVAAAQEAAALGADFIIAQGNEAGGHNYDGLPLFILLPEIVAAVAPIPVLAAGGISKGNQIAAALALGAAGVSIGTRFIASPEANAHKEYKRQLLEANSLDTCLTSIYGPDMPEFNPMRVLNTGLVKAYAGREDDAAQDLDTEPVIATMQTPVGEIPLRRFTSYPPTPDTEGDISDLPLLAGQGVGLVKEIKPVAEIMVELMQDSINSLNGIQYAHE
ncbi:MAG: nitronate monooxygenase [Pseudomonadales bacterium]|nr:nitronate monooxygenase [Pseudomonadales bacterium]MCP5213541.1 nitronate monooxygenase [Pseudomonadales bacterium]